MQLWLVVVSPLCQNYQYTILKLVKGKKSKKYNCFLSSAFPLAPLQIKQFLIVQSVKET